MLLEPQVEPLDEAVGGRTGPRTLDPVACRDRPVPRAARRARARRPALVHEVAGVAHVVDGGAVREVGADHAAVGNHLSRLVALDAAALRDRARPRLVC